MSKNNSETGRPVPPKTDSILNDGRCAGKGRQLLKRAVSLAFEDIRNGEGGNEPDAVAMALEKYDSFIKPPFARVLNATGVLLHTNLGRAPLGRKILADALETASGYCALEYDDDSGSRGDRYAGCAALLRALTGAEDALIVNNNAAAVFLAAKTFSAGRETVVSRGELVEIGGRFRIHEMIASAGAILREVGSTNKTYPEDYSKAAGKDTGLILKVSRSNYGITGFTREVSWREIPAIAKEAGAVSYYDAGSAGLAKGIGFFGETAASELIDAGYDAVSFSGDKLAGSVQCGIILGREEAVKTLRNDPVCRALRPDKLTLSVLWETLRAWAEEKYEDIPVVALCSVPAEVLKKRALLAAGKIFAETGVRPEVTEDFTPAGGGAAYGKTLPGAALRIKPEGAPCEEIALKLRTGSVPVIGRIKDGALILSLRSVSENETDELVRAVCRVLNGFRKLPRPGERF